MKFSAWLVVMALALAATAGAQTAAPAPPSADKINLDAPAAPAPKPAPKKDDGKKAAKKKEDEIGKIDGIEIARPHGFLGIQMVGSNFKLSFYDQKKKPVVADVARAVLHWPVSYQPVHDRTVLNPTGDGKSFTSGKVVRPPLNFKLFISLVPKDAPDDAVGETYVIDFRG